MEMNFLALITAAVSALLTGFIWYSPKLFGNAWMKASGITEEQIKGGNMAKIFGFALLFAFLLALALQGIVIHQMGAYALMGGNPATALPSYEAFMADYSNAYRTFKHGALHGALSGVFIALPILGINALFERKGAKYILVNAGYWVVTLAVMGAIICGWK